MSSDDVLSRAVRALRDESHEESAANTQRNRVLAMVATRRANARRVRTTTTVTLLTLFVATTAWAAATGRLPVPGRFGAAMTRPAPAETTRADRAAMPSSGRPMRPAPSPMVESPTAPIAVPSAPSLEPPAPIDLRADEPDLAAPPARTADPSTRSAAGSRREQAIRPPSPDDPIDALYLAAHRIHFDQRDARSAITAWDRYLAAAPDGRFAPEASYNRALDLARVGRIDEARRALEPFARGAYGTYRQREARDLILRLAIQE